MRFFLALMILPLLLNAVLCTRARAATDADSNPLLRPPFVSGKPVNVAVGIGLLNLTDIDEVEQRFHVNAYVFMGWQDSRLKYVPNPSQPDGSLYARGEVWSPMVEIINAVDPRQSYDAKIKAEPDGLMKYSERFSVTATSKFGLRSFPFDTQNIELVIRPYIGDLKNFTLIGDPARTRMVSEFTDYSSLASWDVGRFDVQNATAQAADGKAVTEVRFQISLKRKSAFYIYKVILPLLLMVALSWAVFWVDPGDLATQVQIAVTTVLTIIAFAFAISASLPRVPYLTFIDAFFLTCYVFVFIAIVELMSVHLSHRISEADRALRIRKNSRWAVPLAFLITNVVLLLRFKII